MLFIGARIQAYRKRQGLSQEEFASEVGVKRQAVSKWETDKAYPDLDKLVTICDILQISITELIYGEIVATFEDSDRQLPEGKEAMERSLPERPGATAASPLEMIGIAVGKVRGKKAYLRLWVMLALIGGMFLFCGALLATTLTHNSWKKEDALAERVRVERMITIMLITALSQRFIWAAAVITLSLTKPQTSWPICRWTGFRDDVLLND